MSAGSDCLIPQWPGALQHVDVVKVRFVLDFFSPCSVHPADFLDFGRALRAAGRHLPASFETDAAQEWQTLFEPALSNDPVARRKFQKPAPAFVLTMPILQRTLLDVGDHLPLEVLFLGSSIPLVSFFLRSLVRLGQLGLVAGQGHFEVTEVSSGTPGDMQNTVWRQNDDPEAISCPVLPLPWMLQEERLPGRLTIRYLTPVRLVVDGRPLRKPRFEQVFPFMLRRVTSMLHAHSGLEVVDDAAGLLEQARRVEMLESRLEWQDWRSLHARDGLAIGGFTGEMALAGRALEDVYWVLAVAALFGIGKGATYGAGGFTLCS